MILAGTVPRRGSDHRQLSLDEGRSVVRLAVAVGCVHGPPERQPPHRVNCSPPSPRVEVFGDHLDPGEHRPYKSNVIGAGRDPTDVEYTEPPERA